MGEKISLEKMYEGTDFYKTEKGQIFRLVLSNKMGNHIFIESERSEACSPIIQENLDHYYPQNIQGRISSKSEDHISVEDGRICYYLKKSE